MNETDLIQALVLQFLQHDGYVETARAFAQDMKVQKEALNIDPNVKVDGLNIRDDEDANNRQREFLLLTRCVRFPFITRCRYTKSYPRRRYRSSSQVYKCILPSRSTG